MKLLLKRERFSEQSTIGRLFIVDDEGKEHFECDILEDSDRKLEESPARKIYGKTAIPRGHFQIVVTYSQRFARPLPLLQNVPGYEGVRIHPGNTPANTDGCLLPGSFAPSNPNFVSNSKLAFERLNQKIGNAILDGQEVWITIS